MKSLSTDSTATKELNKLSKLVFNKTLTGTQAWSLFSSPAKAKIITAAREFKVPLDKIKPFQTLKIAVREHLYKKSNGVCAYCRRPVAHYGYGWQIEHVLSKQWHPSKTFELSNLTVGCIECNSWKGSQVDRKVKTALPLPIINPLDQDFKYSKHLRFVNLSTESLSIAKYKHFSPEGAETYTRLKFNEIERSMVVDSVDVDAASLHHRLDLLLARALLSPSAGPLVDLIAEIKSSIYALPTDSA